LQDIVKEGGKALLLVARNLAIAELCDWIHEMQDGVIIGSHPRAVPRDEIFSRRFQFMKTAEEIVRPTATNIAPVDHGAELKRGALINTMALLASNFRGIFTFLVARLLGPAALGTYLVAWATIELLSKIGLFGLDNAIVAFIARSEAAGDRARSHALFRLAVWLAILQSIVIAVASLIAVRLVGDRLGLNRQLASALSIMFCALPGLALYYINTAVSRGMKVMQHDIFTRGITQSTVTSVAFLLALTVGSQTFAPAFAAVAGTAASGIVALALAWSLFRTAPMRPSGFYYRAESVQILY
jgi:O-antigen/teichoic acid export membrane protein